MSNNGKSKTKLKIVLINVINKNSFNVLSIFRSISFQTEIGPLKSAVMVFLFLTISVHDSHKDLIVNKLSFEALKSVENCD